METKTLGISESIDDRIKLIEQRMLSGSDGHHPNLTVAIEHLLSSGGKRIRPMLVLLTGGMLGAQEDRIVTLAAAIEMLHTATLVHDDLIDGSMLRRGIPTLNARWSDGATVLAGDYIFARAASLAAQTGSLPIMESFARTLMTIVNGEITQLFRSDPLERTSEYLNRVYAKTGSLFELSTEGAALLVQAESEMVERMREFGCNLGIAFQIVDDVLDFTGEAKDVGKPVGNDLRQGLITLPVLYYLEDHSEAYSTLELMGEETNMDRPEMDQFIAEVRQSSAIERSIQTARDYVEDSKEILAEFPDTQEKRSLSDLADYILRRTV